MKRDTTEGLLPPLLSIQQVAEATGFHDRTIRRRVYDGTLPAVRFGPRCLRIKREDVLKLLSPIAPGHAGDAA
jgi:excisionase family DNA binding protein